jgi:hypothetical protein
MRAGGPAARGTHKLENPDRGTNASERSIRAHEKKIVRINIPSMAAMQNSVLQLTHSEGKVNMHTLTTTSIPTILCFNLVCVL